MKKYFILFLFSAFTSINLIAQEENIISLYIYNFTRYIDWPAESSSSTFIIDIIGHKSVYDKLKDNTANRKIGNKNIQVRYLESINGITKSDILFVGYWQSKEISKVLEKIGTTPTLIIGEKPGLLDNGAGINFVIRGDAIKFEIKPSNIQKYGLKISDDLLKLAEKVY